MRTYYSRDHCETYASRLLVRYQRHVPGPLTPPINVDLVGEIVCGLTWDWDDIPEEDGQIIWARLLPNRRTVQMNERHAAVLSDNRGLDRFTRAHEIGHWELHAEQPNPDQLPLFTGEAAGDVVVCRKDSGPWVERQADWFGAALLMPEDLFRAAATPLDLRVPAHCGRLREQFDVSWQALKIRITTLGLGPLPPGWEE